KENNEIVCIVESIPVFNKKSFFFSGLFTFKKHRNKGSVNRLFDGKEKRKGKVKFDLNVGLDNTRVGVTANGGYDTKGENLRGGLGLRVIF
ncbi:hypothetical protein ACW0TE_00555, partial [Fusobacterium polymorphum]